MCLEQIIRKYKAQPKNIHYRMTRTVDKRVADDRGINKVVNKRKINILTANRGKNEGITKFFWFSGRKTF